MIDIFMQGEQEKFCSSFGKINLYTRAKYIITLKRLYPFSDSNIIIQNIIKKEKRESLCFKELINRKNKTPSIGGKKRYILLKLSYSAKIATYTKGVKDF